MISKIRVKPLSSDDQFLPQKGTASAAGYDMRAAISTPWELGEGQKLLVPCGFAIEIPEGYVGLVCPRSGLALKHDITVFNSPGVIDADYRGQVHAMLYHPKISRPGPTMDVYQAPYQIQPGDKIAQLLIVPVEYQWNIEVVDELSSTDRGAGGFGSTGK